LRSSSREIVEPARRRRRPISRRECPCALRSAISSRSANERYRPESGFAEDLNTAGGMPPAFRNNRGPTACDSPALSAASSLFNPAAIPRQNSSCSARPATGGRPNEPSRARVDCFLRMPIATSVSGVLRRPLEPKSGIPCAMVLTLIARSPRGPGAFAPVASRSFCSLDTSVGVSGPHAFTSAPAPFVRTKISRASPKRPSQPASRSVTIGQNALCHRGGMRTPYF